MDPNPDRLSVEELRISREAWWSAEFDDFLWSAFPEVRPTRILDVGCGIGTLERHLARRCPPGATIVGVDIDPSRIREALSIPQPDGPGAGVSYLCADAMRLPFRDGSFGASVVILTLQHLSEPTRALSEMRRVTAPGGTVIAVEADNVGQRLYVPQASETLDAAVDAYWRRIRESRKPADIAIGPRLPHLFGEAGLSSPSLRAHLVVQTVWVEPTVFVEQARKKFCENARRYGAEESPECKAAVAAIEGLALSDPRGFYAITTVPLFLTAARV
jgi:ubiquinone/menaquinone biosynthesis C-methylase UbiE